jgi:hypothetical protein
MLKRRLMLLLVVSLALPSIGLPSLTSAADSESSWSGEYPAHPEEKRQESGADNRSAGGEAETETENEDHRFLVKKQPLTGCRRSHELRDDYDAHLPAGVSSLPERPPQA